MKLALFISMLLFTACKTENINDKSKRNGNWVWWVDNDSNKGEWIPIGKKTTVKNGRYTLFYFNGNVYLEGKLQNEKDIDTLRFHDINGKIDYYRLITPMPNCKFVIEEGNDTAYYYFIEDGMHKIYNQEGNILQAGVSKNHSKYGAWTGYFSDGKKAYTRNFIEDSMWEINYYENGRIKDSSYDFNYNGIYSSVKEWYDNGQLKASIGWKKGSITVADVQKGIGNIQDGIFLEYTKKDDQPNSILTTLATWKDGFQDGVTIRYYESNGKIRVISNWKKGVQNGIFKKYYENGQIQDSNYVENGLVQGKLIEWFQNGKVKRVTNYNNGEIIAEIRYDENGNIISN